MATYPTELAPHVEILVPGNGLGERADAALRNLHEHGMVAAVGLSQYHVGRLGEIAAQEHIVEYCSNDRSRHGSLEQVRAWHRKHDGRGFVAIYDIPENGGRPLTVDDTVGLKDDELLMLSEGWSGYLENRRNPFIEAAPVTTAYRTSSEGQLLARQRRRGPEDRFGLGVPIGELVIASSVVIFGAKGAEISLDCWRSNTRAVNLYDNLGFQLMAEEPDRLRPTLRPIDGLQVVSRQEKGQQAAMARDWRNHYQLVDHPLVTRSPRAA
jgi:hypothetical protein